MTDLSGIRVTLRDCQQAGFCARGAVPWFRENGFDVREVVRSGADAQRMWDTGDEKARVVVRLVLSRRADG